MNQKMEKIARCACYHGMILAKGLWRTLRGTLTAAAMGLTGYAFMAVSCEGGYAAVCDFAAAVLLLVGVLYFVYSFGKERK